MKEPPIAAMLNQCRGASHQCVLSLEDGRQSSHDLINDRGRNRLQPPSHAGLQIQSARLIAANHARGLRAHSHQRDRETGSACEIAAGRDRQYDGNAGQTIERRRLDDQNRARALLFVSLGRIEGDEIDIPAIHHNSSLPTDGASSHCRSSADKGAVASHWASSSSSV